MKLTKEEALEEIDKMITGYQYHVYCDDGNIDPKYKVLLAPLEALQIARAALEEKVGLSKEDS